MERLFRLSERGTDPRTEILAGLSTFLTMAYIVVVNPSIMTAAGIDQGAAFVATCLAAAIGSMLMGLIANFPIALDEAQSHWAQALAMRLAEAGAAGMQH